MTNDHWWHPSVRLWNTLTNAAYPLVGWALVYRMPSGAATMFAFAMTVLGLCSASYHWRRSERTRQADWFGMVFLFAALATYAADPQATHVAWWMAGAAGLVTVFLFRVVNVVGHDAVLGLGLVLMMLPPLFAGPLPAGMALLSLLLFGIAKVFHSEDDQVGHKGHGMWHLLTALAFGVMFLAIVLMHTL